MAAAKKNRHGRHDATAQPSSIAGEQGEARPRPKVKRKEYERQMRGLHGELVAMQEWVKESRAKICVVFEGRDTAGKGGTIKRITERVSPRVFRVVALPTPTEREKSQMYVQRYVQHFPVAGEVVIFDRSWYNRAGVEPVMGFCAPGETERFLEMVPTWEKAMTDSGIVLMKYWLEVSPGEQTRRLQSRINDPRKIWKLSAMDLKSYSRWYDYSGPGTRCLPPPTPPGPLGMWPTPTTRNAPGSTSSATCSARFRTSRSPIRTSHCPNGSTQEATFRQTCPGATSPHRFRRPASQSAYLRSDGAPMRLPFGQRADHRTGGARAHPLKGDTPDQGRC